MSTVTPTGPTDFPDTIVALATATGPGGVAIVRLSGPQVETIGRAMLGTLPAPRHAELREFRDTKGEPVDRGLVLYFPAPGSFTGETVLELHGHGGPVIVEELIAAAVALGARRAEPGEFSKRAFLHGRLDLVQAEAIADLIASGTRRAARAALRSLRGEFSAVVGKLAGRLIELRTYVEAAIDFPDEDIDFLSSNELQQRLAECERSFADLLASAEQGRLLRDGFQLVIVGRPNAGKSSLMNAISGEDAAIVTEIAGTTRDILRERVNLDGLVVELIDTAGFREDPDVIEAEGIRRAKKAVETADAALWLTAAGDSVPVHNGPVHNGPSRPAELEDLARAIPVLRVNNKVDLDGAPAGRCGDAVNISALHGDGLPVLKEAIKELAGYREDGAGAAEGTFTARRRHVEALQRSYARFQAGTAVLQVSQAGELLAEELRLALDELGAITGTVHSDELLGRIFASFCIGK